MSLIKRCCINTVSAIQLSKDGGDALTVLFRISFVQQRPVPCTGLHCTPPRKAREIKDPQVLCPLHRVLCLCVLLCVSVSLCAVSLCAVSLCAVSLCSVRSVGPLNRTSLHSPTQGAGGRETLVFNFSRVCPQCVIARSRPSTRRRACRVDQLFLVQSRRVQDATARRGLNQSFHQLTFVMK